MRDIAALVFGREPGERHQEHRPADDYRRICGEPSPVPGDWCQTKPGEASLAWLGATLSARRAAAARRDHGRP